MKTKNYTSFILIALLLITMGSCSEDEFELPKSEPLINLESEVVSGLPGGTVTLKATMTDPVGIKSIQVAYERWNLDEVIELSDEVSHEFSYELSIPDTTEVGSSHELLIVATNTNGISLETYQKVLLDVDGSSPVLTNKTAGGVTFLGEGNDITLIFDVTDNGSIATFSISGPSLAEEVIVASSKYTYNRSLNIATEGIYSYEVTATDAWGNSTSEVVKVIAYKPFEKMYLADVDTDAELANDLIGVPMIINGFDNVDSLGKVFEAYYYSESANAELRFIPSKTTFSTVTFGAGSAAGTLDAGLDASVSPIVLSSQGYHKVTIDLRDLSYRTEAYTPTDATFDMVQIIGTGVRVNGESTCVVNSDNSSRCFHFTSGKSLTVDSQNPYRFTGTVELFDEEGDGTNAFILNANTDGWAPFWRFNADDSEQAVPGGGSNFPVDPSQYGTYDITFDTHLNRMVVIANN